MRALAVVLALVCASLGLALAANQQTPYGYYELSDVVNSATSWMGEFALPFAVPDELAERRSVSLIRRVVQASLRTTRRSRARMATRSRPADRRDVPHGH